MRASKNYRLFLITFIIIFCGAIESFGQSPSPATFKHTANASNIHHDFTIIDNPATNNRPNKVLFVSHDYGSSGPYITGALGVWYKNNKWIIFNQDRTPMPVGAKFNVLSLTLADRGVFIHTAAPSTLGGHISVIDNPLTNGRPDAKLIVTQNWGNDGPYNNNPIGVYYGDGGKWKVFNQNRVAIPTNAKFNIIVDHPQTFQHTVTSTSGGHITALNNARTDNSPSAFVFTTQLWERVYNAHNNGVWYSADKWKIYNEDIAALPSSSKFNVLSVNLDHSPPPTGSRAPIIIPKTTFTTLLNGYLGNLKIKLNNLGSRHRDSAGKVSWFIENDCYVMLNERRSNFTIPEYTRGLRDKKYYLNDMNLSNTTTRFNGNDLYMTLTFEENGPELKGFCSKCIKPREDNGAPDYQFENNRWEAKLNLMPFEGSITIDVVNFKYLGSVDGAVFGELFDGIITRTLIPKMEIAFRDAFNAQRSQIAEEIRELARRAGFDLSSITRITIEDDNVIFHRS